jgi:hypothetical protein
MSSSWLGGDTGLIPLGVGRVSLWYTKVVGEVPRVDLASSPYVITGYHLVNQKHQTSYRPVTGTLKVYVDGVEVDVTVSGGNQDRFALDSDRAGWIRIEYLPRTTSDSYLYVGRQTLGKTHYDYGLAPLLKVHMTNLIAAINSAERDINLEATLWQVGKLGSMSETAVVTTESVIDKGLFTQIRTAINRLRFVLLNTHQKGLGGSDMSAPSNVVDSEFVIEARRQVNMVEAAIVTI